MIRQYTCCANCFALPLFKGRYACLHAMHARRLQAERCPPKEDLSGNGTKKNAPVLYINKSLQYVATIAWYNFRTNGLEA